jgi:ferric-dicitrate binding protein FerR (iron transport regulator)
LGSLSSSGNVYINGGLAPSESTIFSGDTVLTSDTGTATFTMSGKGSFKLAPETHLVFSSDPRYLAELTSGSLVMTSFAEATEVSLKVGNFVISAVIQTQQSSTKIEKSVVGSYTITCLDGSIGVIPLQGVTGQVLRAGQSVQISSTGELGTPQEGSQAPANQTAQQKKKRTGWVILALAGGGGAAAAAAIAASGGHNHPISPSSM